MPEIQGACLHICIKCRAGRPLVEGAPTSGQALFDRVVDRLDSAPVAALPVECLANCDRGCSAAITMPGKWSYLLGGLDPDLADDLLAYAATYAESRTGSVMPSRRAQSLRDVVIGRIPSLENAT